MPLLERLSTELTFDVGTRLRVGLSGGVDSVVLLHLLSRLAGNRGWLLSALHVHHGISDFADSWAEFCRCLCEQLNVPLTIQNVDIRPLRADLGVEAAARCLRQQALFSEGCDVVALAHHQDDQVETLLLQLLRGTGVRGAAAMSLCSKQQGIHLVRPLLLTSRQQLLNYAGYHQLHWIEDDSNSNVEYARNFLRHQVFPVIEARFPAYRTTLSRATQNFSEANVLLDELAEQDVQGCIEFQRLKLSVLEHLSSARAKNILRFFLAKSGVDAPQSAQIDDILTQLCVARADANVCINFGRWQIRRYQHVAYLMLQLPELDKTYRPHWDGTEFYWPPLQRQFELDAQSFGQFNLALNKVSAKVLRLGIRQGGETLQLAENRPRRTLKNLYQELNIPPWLRDRLPILYADEQVVAVWGVGVELAYQACASN